MNKQLKKTIRKTIINTVILLILCAAAGAIYVYIVDKQANPKKPQASKATIIQGSPLPKATPPAANAPEGVAVVSLLSPVSAGSNSTISVNTNAGSSCTISVSYAGVKSTDSGLAPQIANPYGSASWTWTIGADTPAGSWPIEVTCTYHGRAGVVDTTIQVTK